MKEAKRLLMRLNPESDCLAILLVVVGMVDGQTRLLVPIMK